jgi:hypothetical protein
MMKLVLKVTRPSACLKKTGKGEVVEETKIFDIENKEAEELIRSQGWDRDLTVTMVGMAI